MTGKKFNHPSLCGKLFPRELLPNSMGTHCTIEYLETKALNMSVNSGDAIEKPTVK